MTGVFAGAIYLEALAWFKGSMPQALRGVFQIMGSGLGLVIVLMFLPDGVGSLIYRARDRLMRELADRRGIIVPSLFADKLVTTDEDPDDTAELQPLIDADLLKDSELAEAKT